MLLSTTLIILFFAFLFLFSWMKIKFKKDWDVLNVICVACICAFALGMLLWALIGYVMWLMSIALGCLVLVGLFVGAFSLIHKY